MQVTDHILSRKEAEKKLLQACIALMSLKFTAGAIIALSFVAVALFIFYQLFQAIYEACSQIAQLWTACTPLEKIIVLVVAWAFLAWALKLIKGLRHAAL